MRASQDIMREIDRLYSAYEKEVLLAKEKGFLMDNTVRTYLLHSGNFEFYQSKRTFRNGVERLGI